MLLFFFIFIATCFALVLTSEPVARAYFGAGIFLMVSCVQGIIDVADKDMYIKALKIAARQFSPSSLYSHIWKAVRI